MLQSKDGVAERIRKPESRVCCLPDAHCGWKDTRGLKCRERKRRLVKRETNRQKARTAVPTSSRYRREDKAWHEDKEELSDPAYGYVSKETRISTLKGQVRPCVHCNIICSSHEVEASWASITDEWTTKRGYKHTTECGSALKKNGLSPPATAWQARAAMR